jgi:hypothetical protein
VTAFITDPECVYCAVRFTQTVYLCVFCGPENKQWLFQCTALSDCFYNRDGVCLLRGTFCPHSVFLCFYNRGGVYCAVRSAETMYLWAIISLYSIEWLVFINGKECVYCAVRSAHAVHLCVLWGSENKQRLFHCTALSHCFYNRDGVCLLRGTFCPHSVFVSL